VLILQLAWSIASTTPVEVVKVNHDGLAILTLAGGLIGAFAGITALVFAKRSAHDAGRVPSPLEKA